MDPLKFLVGLAEGFINLFKDGAETFVSWMTGIVPLVLLLIIFMNTLIRIIGEDKILRWAEKAGGNPISRYLVLPFVGSIFFANPMALSLGRFLPEFYKPSYYASASFFCHTSNGVLPHINPGELFIFLGIAQGITTLGLDTGDLAVRYLLVGLVMNFVSGWFTDLTTAWVQRQQGVELSKTLKVVA